MYVFAFNLAIAYMDWGGSVAFLCRPQGSNSTPTSPRMVFNNHLHSKQVESIG